MAVATAAAPKPTPRKDVDADLAAMRKAMAAGKRPKK